MKYIFTFIIVLTDDPRVHLSLSDLGSYLQPRTLVSSWYRRNRTWSYPRPICHAWSAGKSPKLTKICRHEICIRLIQSASPISGYSLSNLFCYYTTNQHTDLTSAKSRPTSYKHFWLFFVVSKNHWIRTSMPEPTVFSNYAATPPENTTSDTHFIRLSNQRYVLCELIKDLTEQLDKVMENFDHTYQRKPHTVKSSQQCSRQNSRSSSKLNKNVLCVLHHHP